MGEGLSAEKDRMRGTGGNRFIGANPTTADLMRSINDQLGDLRGWAADTGRVFDLAEVTISTKRIPSGVVSVSVPADLADDPTHVTSPELIATEKPPTVDVLSDSTRPTPPGASADE